MILAGTCQWYIIRGDCINKPALVRRKHGDLTSFLDIILLYCPENLCKTLEFGMLETAWLCLSMWTVLLSLEWWRCQLTLKYNMNRDPGAEFCLPETCRHLEVLCCASQATAPTSFNSCNQQTIAECDKARVSAQHRLKTGRGEERDSRQILGRRSRCKALMFSPSVERVEMRLAVLHSVTVLSCTKHQEMRLFWMSL